MVQLDDAFYKELERKGNFLRSNINSIIDDEEYNIQPVGLASMFQIYFNPEPVMNYEDAQKSDRRQFLRYFKTLLKQGVFIPPSQFECNFISNAHSMEDLQKTSEAIEMGLEAAFKKRRR